MSNLSPAEKERFEAYGRGPLALVTDACIHHAFEAHAAAHPHAIAAYHRGEAITYRRLDRQANRLAAVLARHGVTTGDRVAILTPRSIPMLVGILAALKAGAAYALQPVHGVSESRLEQVIALLSPRVILTLSRSRSRVPLDGDRGFLAIDEIMEEPLGDDDCYTEPYAPATTVCRDDTCYIALTKAVGDGLEGARISHGNVCNLVLTEPGQLELQAGRRVGQMADLSQDIAAWEILGCLGNGATLVLCEESIPALVQSVDVIITTPDRLRKLDAKQHGNLDVVVLLGQSCPPDLAERWAQSCTVLQCFGCPEGAIAGTVERYRPEDSAFTMGTPMPNNTVYILDETMQPCSIGQIGEVWLGGDCVSDGYLDNPVATHERYRPDPFLGGGRLMARTGELGRWTDNGRLEHHGRIGHPGQEHRENSGIPGTGMPAQLLTAA